MRTLTRAGFMLVELLVGLVVLALFAGVMFAVVAATARAAGHATQALLADRTRRTLEAFLEQELRDATDTDITALSATRLAMPRPIGDATICATNDSAVLVPDSGWTGTRAPEGGRDDAWLLVEPVAGVWQRIAITGVFAGGCPLGNALATGLLLALPPATAFVVRVMEPVELTAYRSGTTDWFGLVPADRSSPVQPFAGPLAPGVTRLAISGGSLGIATRPTAGPPIVVRTPLDRP